MPWDCFCPKCKAGVVGGMADDPDVMEQEMKEYEGKIMHCDSCHWTFHFGEEDIDYQRYKTTESNMIQYFKRQLYNPLYMSPIWRATFDFEKEGIPYAGTRVLDMYNNETDLENYKRVCKQLQYNNRGQRLVYYMIEYIDLDMESSYSENHRPIEDLDNMIEAYRKFGFNIVFKKYANDGRTPIFTLTDIEEEEEKEDPQKYTNWYGYNKV